MSAYAYGRHTSISTDSTNADNYLSESYSNVDVRNGKSSEMLCD